MVNLTRPIQFAPLLLMLPIFSFGDLLSPLQPQNPPLSTHEMSLENRYPNPYVNQVFKDNILLNLYYLRGNLLTRQPNWDEVRKPFEYEFILQPNQTFSYHDDILEKYAGRVSKTTNAHFNSYEGFRSSGYLFGDGVCHLASLIYWVAKDANLEAEAPTNHNFRNIPDISKEYGVSIYSNPYSQLSHSRQNLYITNNKTKPISFKFEYDGQKVRVSISQQQ